MLSHPIDVVVWVELKFLFVTFSQQALYISLTVELVSVPPIAKTLC